MYIVDLFKRLTQKHNIPILIYLILNVFITAFFLYLPFSSTYQFWPFLLIGLAVYLFSLTIALSPLGEFIVRIQTGCREIKRVEQINFIGYVSF